MGPGLELFETVRKGDIIVPNGRLMDDEGKPKSNEEIVTKVTRGVPSFTTNGQNGQQEPCYAVYHPERYDKKTGRLEASKIKSPEKYTDRGSHIKSQLRKNGLWREK